jgi:hypothetical protein
VRPPERGGAVQPVQVGDLLVPREGAGMVEERMMTKWEYLVLDWRAWTSSDYQTMSDWLTSYGNMGWELTHVVVLGDSPNWYLRRIAS